MKKVLVVLAFSAIAVSCKKVTAGGNTGVLRTSDEIERYDTHEVREAKDERAAMVNDSVNTATPETTLVASDSTAVATEAN